MVKVRKMKLFEKKKVEKINDPINLINDCINGLNEVKKKIYKSDDDVNIEYYSVDELDEYVNWGISFKLSDFVR